MMPEAKARLARAVVLMNTEARKLVEVKKRCEERLLSLGWSPNVQESGRLPRGYCNTQTVAT